MSLRVELMCWTGLDNTTTMFPTSTHDSYIFLIHSGQNYKKIFFFKFKLVFMIIIRWCLKNKKSS